MLPNVRGYLRQLFRSYLTMWRKRGSASNSVTCRMPAPRPYVEVIREQPTYVIPDRATLIAVNLEANAASQALAIDDATPRLSWQLSSSATNVMQTWYQIPVATSANLNKSDATWNSGTLSTSNPIVIMSANVGCDLSHLK
jgi:hypothetical protein